ncbi:MAG: hypothetical protein ISR47_06030 [Rhodospirillales bacterium]|nr:hypothetical protein [Rhodospirillales bacterium]
MRTPDHLKSVKDENLRLVLARDEKKYIRSTMVTSRRTAFAAAKGLSIAVLIGLALWPVLSALASAFAGSAASSMVVTAVSIGFIILVPILAVYTLVAVSRYRRCQNYERELRAFLKKYNRAWETI